jgi:hydrogenase maturation protease
VTDQNGHFGPSGAGRVLVAGIGNVFLGDDGFGVEVVRRLDPTGLPDGVDVADYGIRGVHLAYDLLDDRYATLILVDALPTGEPPGTLAVVEADPEANRPADGALAIDTGPIDVMPIDAHSMSPDVVLSALRSLGGRPPRVLVVGCQPAVLDPGMQLSAPVAAAVDEAARIVLRLATADARPDRPRGVALERERI